MSELPRLAPRATDGHKGDYGRILVVAGSRDMSGAAVLCGTAAMRSGAGLVTVACPREVQQTVAAGFPCYMTRGLAGNEDGVFGTIPEADILKLVEAFDVLAIGPGLGRSKSVTKLVGLLLGKVKKPAVLDADGLFALAELSAESLADRGAPTVLTPHPGEFARLLDVTIQEVQSRREELASEFAKLGKCVVLLKGAGTVVTDGQQTVTNPTGNPGMATGGTGDVLSGVIAALMGQGLDAFDAARLGVYVHGAAGDLAADDLGQVSMTARDLLEHLPAAFRGPGMV